MDRDTAVSRLQRRLGFRTDLEAAIIDELQQAQIEHEEEFLASPPWFLLEEISSASTVAGEERLPVPENFLQECEQGTLWVYDSSEDDPWIELPKGFYENLKAYYTTQERPKRYSLVGPYFRLHPTPDKVYTIRLLYYKRDATLTSNIENQWLKYAPGVLMYSAGIAIAAAMRHGSLPWFQDQYSRARAALHTTSISRGVSNVRLVRSD